MQSLSEFFMFRILFNRQIRQIVGMDSRLRPQQTSSDRGKLLSLLFAWMSTVSINHGSEKKKAFECLYLWISIGALSLVAKNQPRTLHTAQIKHFLCHCLPTFYYALRRSPFGNHSKFVATTSLIALTTFSISWQNPSQQLLTKQ